MPEPVVTLRDVARRAGVHPATASRALSPETRPLVSDVTARRVLAAAAALGYRPNAVARSLRTRRSQTIGVLIPDLNNPLFPPMVRGLEDELGRAGYVALIANTDGDPGRERQLFEQMRIRHVDGYALATARLRSPLLAEAAGASLNVVLMNRIAQDGRFPSVSVDNERGAGMAVAHLASLGHRRIAYIAGPQNLSTGLDRYRGFMAGMRSAGLTAAAELMTFAATFTIEAGHRCARQILAACRDLPGDAACTAMAAGNDMLAVGCYEAIEEAGLRCPDDISVVGFNDMPFVDRLRPPLSTVAFPHYQVGAEAAAMLLDRLADSQQPARTVLVAPQFVARGSTALPATWSPPARSARTRTAG